ncbi:MAG: T9SS type A sorting domain-containing protein [Chitinophagales bacterium]|nr:T9SS type A sorting domain-containing protein [Chitinophagales bacterium]
MQHATDIRWMVTGIIILLAGLSTGSNYAQEAGTIDSTFGTNGVVYCTTNFAPFNDTYCAFDDQENIISVSNFNDNSGFLLMRHTIDGLIDSSFGLQGSTAYCSPVNCGVNCMKLDGNNRILVGGYIKHIPDTLPLNYYDFCITRFLPNGNLDSSFGLHGQTAIDLGETEMVNDLALQNDSLILISGNSGFNAFGYGNTDVVLIRLQENGTPDSSFGTNSVVITDLIHRGFDQDYGSSLLVQPDGKILQIALNGPGINVVGQMCLLRYQHNGMMDSTFAKHGKFIESHSNSYNAHGNYIGLKTDGTIVVACNDGDVFGGGYFYTIRQLTPSGFADSSFADNGIIESMHGYAGPGIYAMQLQPDNKIVAFTREYDMSTQEYFTTLTRFTAQGFPDPGFGSMGRTLVDVNCLYANTLYDICMKPADKITLLALTGDFPGKELIFIARYNNDNTSDIHNEASVYPEEWFVYPNPSSGFLIIAWYGKVKNVDVTITGITGKIMYRSSALYSAEMILNISDFPDGLYMVQLSAGDFIQTKKILVEN